MGGSSRSGLMARQQASWNAQVMQLAMKLKGGKGMKGLKGAGKGLVNSKVMMVKDTKFKDKLGKMENNLKVWIGNLNETTTWKTLEKHFEEMTTKPRITEVMGKGRAC